MTANVSLSHGLRGALPWQMCHSVARISHAGIFKPRVRARKHSSTLSSPRASLPQAVQDVLATIGESSPGLPAGLLVNSTVFLVGLKVLLRGLTPEGVVHSWALGTAVYSAFGAGGYVLVCLYFILGSAVTKVKLAQKQKEGIAEARSGRRTPGSVWGSGFAGTLCAVAALATGHLQPWQIGFVASFVSKLSDTVSSEIGKAYGQTTYLITTMQRVPRGTEGAVSAEGTAAGAAAAVLFAGIAVLVGQVAWKEALIVAAAATVANLFESYLGALVQGQVEWLTNDVVNMIQISIAAALAIAAQLILLG
ncbi:Protein VTE6, chloroplastic [Coccomyxa sp. Obi]|nr:Protein VTE6, chloroplastic [Coccomyxa sp. Obi]